MRGIRNEAAMEEPELNPYRSPAVGNEYVEPRSIEGPFRPDYKLYSPGSIVLATFFGSPVAGGIVMAINYKRLGRLVAAVHAVVWTVVFTAAIITVAMILPDDVHIPNSAFVVPQLIAMYFLAASLQGRDLEEHQRRGGLRASAWGAAGIGVLVGVAIAVMVFGTIFGVVMLSPE
jgi:hypothetical protein